MTLSDYSTLGKSGLIVSPLALGTMTFGNPSWGSPDDVSERIFHTYLDQGGNFVDTADIYSGGRSEELVGSFIRQSASRDRIVLSTKFGFNAEAGNPHAGGNGRKNIHRALESSLRRLGTDYIDLYWMHVWDMVTPVEEVLQTLTDLVRQGKIRYFGFSDMPAWYAAKAGALARDGQLIGPVAQQLYYSLAERSIEREHLPAARDAGQGIVPWSPLAYGFLTGKYSKASDGGLASGNGRLDKFNPMFPEVTDQHWATLDALREVADASDYSMAQIALAWVANRPGVDATLTGASSVEQLTVNIGALEVDLPREAWSKLDAVSRPGHTFPYHIFTPEVNRGVFGGHRVRAWSGGN